MVTFSSQINMATKMRYYPILHAVEHDANHRPKPLLPSVRKYGAGKIDYQIKSHDMTLKHVNDPLRN